MLGLFLIALSPTLLVLTFRLCIYMYQAYHDSQHKGDYLG